MENTTKSPRPKKYYYTERVKKLLKLSGTTYDKKYYDENPDIYYEAHKRYYLKNKEYLQAYGREYYQRNKIPVGAGSKPRRSDTFEELKRLRNEKINAKQKLILHKKQIVAQTKIKRRLEQRISTIDRHVEVLTGERVRKVDELQKINTWLNENKIKN